LRTGRIADRFDERSSAPRTLAGATVLQIVPALQEQDARARTALNVAYMLLQAGARTLVAGREGPLVGELKAFGGEWIALASEGANPLTRRRNIRLLENLIGSERIDLIHAQCVGGAALAQRAAERIAVWLVTTLPDVPPTSPNEFAQVIGELARGDRIIAPSSYAARPVMERLGVSREQITVIPRSVDTAVFDARAVHQNRLDLLRNTWRISPQQRVIMVPGRVAPWNGQVLMPDIARALADAGYRNMVFAIVGENREHRRYARELLARAQALNVDDMFHITGHCPDMPAAFAIADVVAVPAIEAPVLGRVVAQAQATGRPVVTSNVGVLPEYVVTPPQMPEDVRTGWVTAAGDPLDMARGLAHALSLDDGAYHAMCARAREFAEYMLSPESVAVATRAVYTSLLMRGP
jgi:glycosyltransferase involved in cell wall biosynthesis